MSSTRVVVVAFLSIFPASEGYIFSNEASLVNFCAYNSHYVLNSTFTCCNSTVVRSGFDLDRNWETCSEELSTNSKNLLEATWEIYTCVIRASLGKKDSVSLLEFSEIISAKYPVEIKTAISREVTSYQSSSNLKVALSQWKELDKVRQIYFKIEEGVCRGISSNLTEDYGKIRPCVSWEESTHRGGQCCGSRSFPFDVSSFAGLNTSLNEVACQQQLGSLETQYLTETMKIEMLHICELSCKLLDNGVITKSDLKEGNLDDSFLEEIATALTPAWIPPQVSKMAVDYAVENLSLNETTEMIENLEIEDVDMEMSFLDDRNNLTVPVLKWVKRKFPADMKVPVICAVHQQLDALIQFYLFSDSCQGSEDDEVLP